MSIAAVPDTGLPGYVLIFLAVGASWAGIPFVGAGVLAAASVLASEGQLNLWLVILAATAGAWCGGLLGYRAGREAGDVVSDHPGSRQRTRAHAMETGQRIYRRWGRLAVFLTPTFVSGAMHMPWHSFLRWNLAAALVSNTLAVLGIYGIGSAILSGLSSRPAVWVPAAAAGAIAAAGTLLWWLGRGHGHRRDRHDRDAMQRG